MSENIKVKKEVALQALNELIFEHRLRAIKYFLIFWGYCVFWMFCLGLMFAQSRWGYFSILGIGGLVCFFAIRKKYYSQFKNCTIKLYCLKMVRAAVIMKEDIDWDNLENKYKVE